MRVCSGRKGSWEGLVIVRTVGHGQFQAVTHFHEQDHCSLRWRATPLSGSPAQLNSSSSQKKTKLEGAEETLCKVAKLPNTSIEVLEISTKVTFFFFFNSRYTIPFLHPPRPRQLPWSTEEFQLLIPSGWLLFLALREDPPLWPLQSESHSPWGVDHLLWSHVVGEEWTGDQAGQVSDLCSTIYLLCLCASHLASLSLSELSMVWKW